MITCSVVYADKESIYIVTEKSNIVYLFNKFNQTIDDEIIVNNIKDQKPIEVSKDLYVELSGLQVINQHRVDSLLQYGIEQFYFYNQNNTLLLNPNILANETLMEELYTIKVLFDNKILLQQDDESGYYYEIK